STGNGFATSNHPSATMPTYLVHGFRWQRQSIRIHIILYDLEDAAPDWIVSPATTTTILNSFYTLYDFLPPSRKSSAASSNGNTWSEPEPVIKLIEQFDETDEKTTSQPYAYVADQIIKIPLSVDVMEAIKTAENTECQEPVSEKKQGWFVKLRDQLQKEAEIR